VPRNNAAIGYVTWHAGLHTREGMPAWTLVKFRGLPCQGSAEDTSSGMPIRILAKKGVSHTGLDTHEDRHSAITSIVAARANGTQNYTLHNIPDGRRSFSNVPTKSSIL